MFIPSAFLILRITRLFHGGVVGFIFNLGEFKITFLVYQVRCYSYKKCDKINLDFS
jgi:hypothetical protein